jgi:regulator of replication initiation timing
MLNTDEIKQLKSRLTKSIDECEQLKLLNKKLLNEIQKRQSHLQTSSPKQVRFVNIYIYMYKLLSIKQS